MVGALEGIRLVLEPRADVRLAYVFGSTARGEARPESDVDVAVLFDPEPGPRHLDSLTSDLQAAARRPVDLVVLNTAPPLLVHQILKTGRRVLTRAEDERVRFETRATARYLDTAHLRRVQHQYLRERADAFRARQP
ncbi:MAG: type VII toxin-antitoxin system MntA family adenylyltransferase antitoxin [Candidatus Rokuibacteriota bacterium]